MPTIIAAHRVERITSQHVAISPDERMWFRALEREDVPPATLSPAVDELGPEVALTLTVLAGVGAFVACLWMI